MRSKYRASSVRSASGSSASPRSVEAVRSQKRTVTVLRCSPLAAAPSGDAHSPQNLAASLFSWPQLVQIRTSGH